MDNIEGGCSLGSHFLEQT